MKSIYRFRYVCWGLCVLVAVAFGSLTDYPIGAWVWGVAGVLWLAPLVAPWCCLRYADWLVRQRPYGDAAARDLRRLMWLWRWVIR